MRSVSATCGVERQRRVAAGEDQLEPLVGKVVSSIVSSAASGTSSRRVLSGEGALAADAVDGPVAGRGHRARPGVGRHAVARPALRRDRERLLRGLLGEVEVAEEADQAGQDAAPLLAEDVASRIADHSTIGRTSIEPPLWSGRDLARQLDGRVEVVAPRRRR